MKAKQLILVFLLLLLAVIALLWLRAPTRDFASQPTLTNAQGAVTEPVRVAPKILLAPQDDVVSMQERIEQLRLDSRWDWKRPIRFYGKVVDEGGQPVPGATANISWSNSDGEGNSASPVTDRNGLFSLSDQRGKGIQVRIHHPSFYNSTNNPISFEYADGSSRFFHRPNADAPIIFTLKQKGQSEPLIVFKKSSRIAKDGTPAYLDLIRGSVSLSPQGQLKLECLTMDKERDPEKRYDWTFTITVPNGGVLESTNEFDFVAPSEAYSPTNVFIMRKEMGVGWNSKLEKNYFLKLGDGTFGRMRLTMIPGGDHFFKIESFVNPSGSRNLEFDPSVQPKQTQVE